MKYKLIHLKKERLNDYPENHCEHEMIIDKAIVTEGKLFLVVEILAEKLEYMYLEQIADHQSLQVIDKEKIEIFDRIIEKYEQEREQQ